MASPDTRRTVSNVTASPTAPGSFSTRSLSPGSTRYCLPPVFITAYIVETPSWLGPRPFDRPRRGVQSARVYGRNALCKGASRASRRLPCLVGLVGSCAPRLVSRVAEPVPAGELEGSGRRSPLRDVLDRPAAAEPSERQRVEAERG